ncbi:MAG: hypothetical protein ACR2PX_29290 [Endozoicomonas sp.]
MATETSDTQILLSTWQDTLESYQGQKSFTGFACDPRLANKTLPAGIFLECRVRYNDLSGYYSAWNAVHNFFSDNHLIPDRQAPILEIIHNPFTDERTVDMSIEVYVDDQLSPGLVP